MPEDDLSNAIDEFRRAAQRLLRFRIKLKGNLDPLADHASGYARDFDAARANVVHKIESASLVTTTDLKQTLREDIDKIRRRLVGPRGDHFATAINQWTTDVCERLIDHLHDHAAHAVSLLANGEMQNAIVDETDLKILKAIATFPHAVKFTDLAMCLRMDRDTVSDRCRRLSEIGHVERKSRNTGVTISVTGKQLIA